MLEFLGNKFAEANLIEPEDKEVKLHVTVINTKLRRVTKPEKDEEDSEDNQPERPSNAKDTKDVFETAQAKNRIPLDASGIMTQFRDYSFGKCRVSGIFFETEIHS